MFGNSRLASVMALSPWVNPPVQPPLWRHNVELELNLTDPFRHSKRRLPKSDNFVSHLIIYIEHILFILNIY